MKMNGIAERLKDAGTCDICGERARTAGICKDCQTPDWPEEERHVRS